MKNEREVRDDWEFKRKTVFRTFNSNRSNRLPLLVHLAECDQDNLRRLWLLTQYQNYQSRFEFSDGVYLFAQRMYKDKGIIRTPPTSVQVLGILSEKKQKEFNDYWKLERGINIYKFALSNNPLYLALGEHNGRFFNDDIVPIWERKIQLGRSEWLDAISSLKKREPMTESFLLPSAIESEWRCYSSGSENNAEIPF